MLTSLPRPPESMYRLLREWRLLRSLLPEHFGQGVIWNLGSVSFLAVSGILLSVLVARFYGPEGLGLFNQSLAIYVVASQISVFGLQLSVLTYGGERVLSPGNSGMLAAAILLSLMTGVATGAALYFGRGLIAKGFQSPGLARGLLLVSISLPLFAINKVLLAWLNAQHFMRAFATLQAIRYAAMIAALIWLINRQALASDLAWVFAAAEGTVFCIAGGQVVARHAAHLTPRGASRWLSRHLWFGARAFWGAALVEVSPRIDVLMLGLFADDRAVGTYSLASMFALGFSQLLAVLRVNVNPVLARLYGEQRQAELQRIMHQGKVLVYAVTAILSVVAVVVYPILIRLLIAGQGFAQSWAVFGTLLAGILVASGYLPFLMLLSQAGRPELYTAMLLLMVASSITINTLLIPALGALGAAISNVCAQILGVALLRQFAWRALGLRF